MALGTPLCSLYAAILNQRIVSWSEDSGLGAPCQAGFRIRMSTSTCPHPHPHSHPHVHMSTSTSTCPQHQLFALRHLVDRSRFHKQPLFTAFVAYDSRQHQLLWASLQRKGVHGKMLAAIQSLYAGGSMSKKVCGSSGASGTAQVGVRQGCRLRPTLFGLLFDDLCGHLQAECPRAGVQCRGSRIPSLYHANDVALLSASAHGLQSLLDSMQSFCAANGLTGHQRCQDRGCSRWRGLSYMHLEGCWSGSEAQPVIQTLGHGDS